MAESEDGGKSFVASSLISCIVPVFNGERYLRAALDSMPAQTYRPLEIIVADDGSTDGTTAVAASYGEQIFYLRQANVGPAAARNLGLSVARGEFVAFLDADDLWYPKKLARQMDRFEARQELDLCMTFVQNFWTPELQAAAQLRNHQLMQPLPGYPLQTLMAKRALFDTVGQFNPQLRIGDDTDWFLRAAEQRAIMELLPEVLVYRRFHHTNLTRVRLSERVHIFKASLDRRRLNKIVSAPLNLLPPAKNRRT